MICSRPVTYQTKNNRLMYYEVFEGFEELVLVERVDYEYDPLEAAAAGNPSLVVRKREDETIYHGTFLQYNKSAELWFAIEQTWDEDDPYCNTGQVLNVTEFRGGGRARYMVRQRDPVTSSDVLPETERWSDYDGDVIYGDYIIDQATGDPIDTTAYLPGIAQMDTQTGDITYLHSDQIGSLRFASTEYGQPAQMVAYTAFGEIVHQDGTIGTRYQYAGTWGYEEAVSPDPLAALGWLHVGYRYYNPSTGRFAQRDPIGIWGGFNVYQYVESTPTAFVDPAGQGKRWDKFKKKVKKAAKATWDVAKNVVGYLLPSSPVPASVAPDAARCYAYDAKRRHALKDHEDSLPDPNCPICERLTPESQKGRGW